MDSYGHLFPGPSADAVDHGSTECDRALTTLIERCQSSPLPLLGTIAAILSAVAGSFSLRLAPTPRLAKGY